MSRNTAISRRSNSKKFKLEDYSNYKLKEGKNLQTIQLDEKDEIFSDDSAFESNSDCLRADEEHELNESVTPVNELSDKINNDNPFLVKTIKGPNLFFTQVEFDDF